MVPKTAITLAAAFSAVAAAAASIEKRITGGEEAQEGEFGPIVSIQSQNGHFCAGSLLDSTTVLTAAHCASNTYDDDRPVIARAGTLDPNTGGVEAKVVAAHRPDHDKLNLTGEYTEAYWLNDIAILKLSTPIEKSDKIGYATLPADGSDPMANSTAIAVGWGTQGAITPVQHGWVASKLSKVTIPIHAREKCSKLDSGAAGRDTIVCAGGDGKGICKFDSGGPLIDQKMGDLIGLSSFGIEDAEGNLCNLAPAVFTRVSSYIPFIKEYLGASGYPSSEELRIRKATTEVGKHCNRFLNDAIACRAAAGPCIAEWKPDTTTQELRQCVDRMQICADQREPGKHGQCINNAKICIGQEDMTPGDLDVLAQCAKKDL
ncbi:peptidase S1 domain protein [Metarhizium robertsii]|uniref:Peptidase S1/S6, chymotrypsin/Hap, active site protein n=2 Tax=Metarhizium robertsii TaxID=568076 RepID=E9EJS4_METRA|nr:Peptidase S1/S6, chymotrypsin/Hap, active site protein [Metarhizium robertsii ARSEF 23]EFZ03809.1 Peptidase S1/S6, chymotrypsin/Hap, active site protein [Metarhizium robertsii ARSEF 23]EXU94550.1 peptidase S1 domain protein [Metarhizium robertsii]